MADGTKIEWTDATWNPITGCSVVSPGCTNCYAMKLAGTRLKNHPTREGLTNDSKAGPVWNGQVRFNEGMLLDPLRWRRPRMIFVCAHGDLFAENVPDEWIDQVFAVMALAPQHTFQVLTKRPERMRGYLHAIVECYHASPEEMDRRFGEVCVDLTSSPCASGAFEDRPWPLPNVWLGVSVEDQKRAEERIPVLLETPAAVRWISAEPLLGPIDIRRHIEVGHLDSELGLSNPGLDWVVAGGESGHNARPMHPDWARSLRDQCAAADVPFLFKQWGEWGKADFKPSGTPGAYAIATAGPDTEFWPQHVLKVDSYPRQINLFGGGKVLQRVGKRAAGRLLDGVEHNAFPRRL